MKKLFDRLSRNRSFTRLFSILVFAAVAAPGLSFAHTCSTLVNGICVADHGTPQRLCKNSVGLVDRRVHCANTCGQVGRTEKSNTCSGGSGGSGNLGSSIQGVVLFGDEFGGPGESSSSCGGPGLYFDVTRTTAPGQTTSCKVIDDQGEHDRLCSYDLVHRCFKAGNCKQKTRVSESKCPALDANGDNLSGSTGTVTVFDLNGIQLPSSPGHPNPINIGTVPLLVDVDTNTECANEFPSGVLGLGQRVTGKITQECTNDLDVIGDPIMTQVLRSTNGYSAAFDVAITQPGSCTPSNGFPFVGCENSGLFWFYFNPGSGEQLDPANFSCGQIVDENDQILDGPPPVTCGPSDKAGFTFRCQCQRCIPANTPGFPEGTLVNPGTGNQGLFVLHSSDNAYACPVTESGN
jgi:hypothetical protein